MADLDGYRRVAVGVLAAALEDARASDPVVRARAIAWLTSPTEARDRALWLQLAGLDEQAVVERFQGSSFSAGDTPWAR